MTTKRTQEPDWLDDAIENAAEGSLGGRTFRLHAPKSDKLRAVQNHAKIPEEEQDAGDGGREAWGVRFFALTLAATMPTEGLRRRSIEDWERVACLAAGESGGFTDSKLLDTATALCGFGGDGAADPVAAAAEAIGEDPS